MKLLLSILGSAVLYIVLFTGGAQLAGCTKTTVQYDTTIVRDSLTIKDTVVVRDTVQIAINHPIVGLYVGTLLAGNDPAAGPLYYSLDLRADKTILTQSLGNDGTTYYSAGTWSISGTSFTATITSTTTRNVGTVQNLTAVCDSLAGTLTSGTYITPGLANSEGTFTVARIP